MKKVKGLLENSISELVKGVFNPSLTLHFDCRVLSHCASYHAYLLLQKQFVFAKEPMHHTTQTIGYAPPRDKCL